MLQYTNIKVLSEVASIRTGYTFREKIEDAALSKANAHIAQIKDVRLIAETTSSMSLNISQLPTIEWQGKDKAIVPPGSVLLPSRGSRGGYFKASYLIDNKGTLPLIVTSQFLVITANDCVLPEFLCWSLNQPQIQFWLSEGAGSQGSGMVMLKTNVGNDIKINIPSIEVQKKIININQLWEKEQELNTRLQANREMMLKGMYQKLLNENN
ncbi:restriction endonuclease subunit S [Aliivibrio fischeri]|uniref:restriction endonuclease subunit S n=1 Tax=Aliivibrio fischeri TaxID=668 RepID=UPI0012D88BBF|nr:restriction endonuclease subunit S [Aliivibrio fischeri]MUK37859.1 restriction endonuclease subunit S [Aliivibrio fischeri]MUL07118.1 restriction endonuclease subunit S [Aliivibrio fischeri]